MNHLKIESDQQYQEIAAKIEALKNVEPGTSKAFLLKFLVHTIVHHEKGIKASKAASVLTK